MVTDHRNLVSDPAHGLRAQVPGQRPPSLSPRRAAWGRLWIGRKRHRAMRRCLRMDSTCAGSKQIVRSKPTLHLELTSPIQTSAAAQVEPQKSSEAAFRVRLANTDMRSQREPSLSGRAAPKAPLLFGAWFAVMQSTKWRPPCPEGRQQFPAKFSSFRLWPTRKVGRKKEPGGPKKIHRSSFGATLDLREMRDIFRPPEFPFTAGPPRPTLSVPSPSRLTY